MSLITGRGRALKLAISSEIISANLDLLCNNMLEYLQMKKKSGTKITWNVKTIKSHMKLRKQHLLFSPVLIAKFNIGS